MSLMLHREDLYGRLGGWLGGPGRRLESSLYIYAIVQISIRDCDVAQYSGC